MSNALVPCPSCSRHLRSSESTCPFCSAALPVIARAATQRALPTARLGRAATFAFGAAALTVSAAACGDDTTPAADSGTARDLGADVDLGGIAPLYGMPADAGPDVDADTNVDLGGIAPAYGLPADAGADDAGAEVDLGGVGLLYGAPPP